MDYHIRNIQHSDNPFLDQIIRNCFIELDAPKTGNSIFRPQLQIAFMSFLKQKKNSFCLVAESNNGVILGLCGIYATDGLEPKLWRAS